jgi:hypothetical protein
MDVWLCINVVLNPAKTLARQRKGRNVRITADPPFAILAGFDPILA